MSTPTRVLLRSNSLYTNTEMAEVIRHGLEKRMQAHWAFLREDVRVTIATHTKLNPSMVALVEVTRSQARQICSAKNVADYLFEWLEQMYDGNLAHLGVTVTVQLGQDTGVCEREPEKKGR